MKIAGIIAEYNPLHAGHIYHMNETRRRTRCDYLVCVLGGSFTQRGEMALFDKFARVRMALAAGADAVFELSAVYAMRCAQLFARGGAGVLAALGADALSFGCETEDMEKLYKAKALIEEANAQGRDALGDVLASGASYPKALAVTAASADAEIFNLLGKPNFVLALEYIKELERRGSPMALCPIKRTSPYHADDTSLFSASSVRRMIETGQAEAVLASLPGNLARLYAEELPDGVPDVERVDALILAALRNADPSTVFSPDASEGLLNRLKTCARQSATLEEALFKVKCKRYTLSRIRRLIMDTVLRLPEAPEEVPYLRLLGAREGTNALLNELKKRASNEIVSRASLLDKNEIFKAECRATDLWGLAVGRREYRLAGREYTQKFVTY